VDLLRVRGAAEREEGVVGPDAVVHEARVLARDARRRRDDRERLAEQGVGHREHELVGVVVGVDAEFVRRRRRAVGVVLVVAGVRR